MDTEKITLAELAPGSGLFVHHGGPRITDPFTVCDGYTAAYAAHSPGTLYLAGTGSVEAYENDVFLIPPGAVFRFLPIKGLRRMDVYYCYFSLDAVGKHITEILSEQFAHFRRLIDCSEKYIRAADTACRDIRDIFIRMIDEELSALPCSGEALSGFLRVLLVKLLRASESHAAANNHSRMTDEAVRYINKHMYEKISLAGIAGHLKLSPSLVCRRFKADTGMTTAQFINRVRTEKIKDILKNTSKPAEAIPEMFSCSPEHLKRMFKSLTGMSMTEYRSKYNYKSPARDDE